MSERDTHNPADASRAARARASAGDRRPFRVHRLIGFGRKGAAYTERHPKLVKPFLEESAETAPVGRLKAITAGGPPLEVVINGVARLANLCAAATGRARHGPRLAGPAPGADRCLTVSDRSSGGFRHRPLVRHSGRLRTPFSAQIHAVQTAATHRTQDLRQQPP
jgi:Domain of unknown function (DUF1864)